MSWRVTQRTRIRYSPAAKRAKNRSRCRPISAPSPARLLGIVRREGKELLLANLLLPTPGLVDEANKVKAALDREAWEIVDRFLHATPLGAAAAVSPMVIDLVVGSGITAKMLVDLARVYKRKLDLNAAGMKSGPARQKPGRDSWG